MTAEAEVRELISFRVGDQEYGVDIAQVREIRGWTPATPLPRTPAYVRGVINLRGAVLPIIDMAERMGLPPSEPTARNVIVVVWLKGQLVGLLVDAVCDILQAGADELQTTPEMIGGDAQSFVTALFELEDRLIGLVRLEAILPPDELQAA